MDEILNTLETLAWWFREGGSPLHGAAMIMDDEKTLREHVNLALAEAHLLSDAKIPTPDPWTMRQIAERMEACAPTYNGGGEHSRGAQYALRCFAESLRAQAGDFDKAETCPECQGEGWREDHGEECGVCFGRGKVPTIKG